MGLQYAYILISFVKLFLFFPMFCSDKSIVCNYFFSFILLTHEGSHGEVYQEFQSSYDIFSRRCQGLFCAPPAYTAQLLTLYQLGFNNQCRKANQISRLIDLLGAAVLKEISHPSSTIQAHHSLTSVVFSSG